MNFEQRAVKDFHKKFGIKIGKKPKIIDYDTANLRYDLIDEELQEFWLAYKEKNIIGIADALGDLLYVVYGAGISFGIDLEPIFKEIHKSNMKKSGGNKRSDGKQLKPKNWKQPNLKKIIEEQS